jgi:hypothetical protein
MVVVRQFWLAQARLHQQPGAKQVRRGGPTTRRAGAGDENMALIAISGTRCRRAVRDAGLRDGSPGKALGAFPAPGVDQALRRTAIM